MNTAILTLAGRGRDHAADCPRRFCFHYRARVPWRQLRALRNKLPLLLAAVAAPVLRLLDFMGPVASNNLAAVIVKPDLPAGKFPWVEQRGAELVADRGWFRDKFGST